MFGFQTLGALILLTPNCLIGWNIEQGGFKHLNVLLLSWLLSQGYHPLPNDVRTSIRIYILNFLLAYVKPWRVS